MQCIQSILLQIVTALENKIFMLTSSNYPQGLHMQQTFGKLHANCDSSVRCLLDKQRIKRICKNSHSSSDPMPQIS